jgi:hypothetical protein
MIEKNKRNGSNKIRLASGRTEVSEVLETCEAIQRRKFNPFLLDVERSIATLRKYFSYWKTFEEHCLDARTLNSLSDVIRLQNSQLRYESSTLYADPKFLSEKIRSLSSEDLARIFLKSWHPIVELEQFALTTVKEALQYWDRLLPFDVRRKRLDASWALAPSALDSQSLESMGIVTQETFSESLEELWNEMKRNADQSGEVNYWKFVKHGSYEETAGRAYLVSFLVTYGYATLEKRDENLLLIPHGEKKSLDLGRLVSFPISLKSRQGGIGTFKLNGGS